jgi:putative phosphotransacetylase
MDKEKLVAFITDLVIKEIEELKNIENTVPVGISARHVHLSQGHLEILFGRGYKLTHFKDLSQPGQFAANEKVEIIGPKGSIADVRVLGPIRPHTQIELAAFEARKLGAKAPVRASGNLVGTPGITLKGPAGEVNVPFGVIIAERHIHMSEEEAKRFNLRDKDMVTVIVDGPKGGKMSNVVIRSGKSHELDFHVDTDDANAFNLAQGQRLRIEKCQ